MSAPTATRSFVTAAIALGLLAATAQAVPPADAPRSPLVMEDLDVAYRFENDGTYTHRVRARILVATERGRRAMGELYFPYQRRSSRVELRYLRTMKPSGESIEVAPDQLFDTAPPGDRRSPVFSDLMYKAVPVPGLEVGDHVEYEKTTTWHTPLAAGEFWGYHRLTRRMVVENETVRLDLPAGRMLAFEWDRSIEHDVERAGGRQVHRWTHASPNPLTAGPHEKYLFHVSTFRSWPELGAWMHELIAQRAVSDEALTALAHELVGDATDPRAKVERLHAYVAQSVRYVRVALGIGSYQPHAAATVRRNLYGDCKDKHALLAVLLDAVGIASRPALVHSSGEAETSVPSPQAFDHLITVVDLDGERLWLDATEELAPAGWLAPALRGSPALVVREKHSRLEQVPPTVPVPDARRALLRGAVDADGGLRAELRVEHRGSFEVGWRSLFRRGNRQELDEALQLDRPSTLRHAVAGRATTSDPLDTTGPFVVEYDLEQPSWFDAGTAMQRHPPSTPPGAAPLPSLPSLILGSFAQVTAGSAGAGDASNGLANGDAPRIPEGLSLTDGGLVGPLQLEERVLLELPPGLELEPPPDVRDERDFATYAAEYVVRDGVLEATRRLEIRDTRLTPARRGDVVAFVRSVQDDVGRPLRLRQTAPE